MLHTFVGDDADAVRDKVREPLIEYLRSSADLIKQYAWSFPAFKKREAWTPTASICRAVRTRRWTRCSSTRSSATSRPAACSARRESCLAMVDRLKGIGVDEIACLIDFGVDSDVGARAPGASRTTLRRLSAPAATRDGERLLASPALMQRHRVTHLQCTPSMARMLSMDGSAARQPRRRCAA